MKERRKFVRVRPLPELPLVVAMAVDGVDFNLEVIDVSVGGLGLYPGPELGGKKVEDAVALRLKLADASLSVSGRIRHLAPESCGIAFETLEPDTKQTLARYVSELLERGSAA